MSLSLRNRGPAAWIVLVPFIVAGCGQANTFAPPPPPEVTVARPVRRAVTNYLEATGTTQPLLSVDIRARVKGFLKERHFKEGSMVKKGDLLLVIDEESFQVSLDEAKTRLDEAEASLLKAKQSRAREVARAQVALDESQLRLARLAEARRRNLATRHASTQEEADQAEASRKKSEAQVEASRAHLEQAVSDYETNIISAEATVRTMRTTVKNAQIELGYCRMFAPIDGRITRVNIHVGNLVGDAQSSLLATIVKLDPIYAYINVNELDLPRFRKHGGDPGRPSAPMVPCGWSWRSPRRPVTRISGMPTTRTRASTPVPAPCEYEASSTIPVRRSCPGCSCASASRSTATPTRCSSRSGH